MRVNIPTYILVHCTDYPMSKMENQLKACDGWHKDRGFPKSSLNWYVGYHRLITGGENHQTRLDNDEGAHCNQVVDGKSMNIQSLAVCMGFDGDVEMPAQYQVDLLREQIWAWQDKYGVPDARVKFHRFFAKDKSCPGKLLTEDWLAKLIYRTMEVKEPPCKVPPTLWQKIRGFFNR